MTRTRTTWLTQWGAVAVLGGWLVGCGSAGPDEENLRASFASQIAEVPMVRTFERDADQLTFVGPGPGGQEAAWLVSIDSVEVEPYDSEQTPYRGLIRSSWYADGELIEPVGTMSGLPSDFLELGIAQECWGLWDVEEGRWTW